MISKDGGMSRPIDSGRVRVSQRRFGTSERQIELMGQRALFRSGRILSIPGDTKALPESSQRGATDETVAE